MRRLVYIDGKLQTRRLSKPGEDGDRFSTEILLIPGGPIQFLGRPNGNNTTTRDDQPSPVAANAMPSTDAGDASDLRSRDGGHCLLPSGPALPS